MKKTKLFLAGLLAGISGLIAPQWSNASTAPCTLISNTATAAYSVGGVAQPGVTSAATTFNVGVKVIVSVANNDGNEVTVVPGTSKYALKFTITNNGNAVQDYDLSSIAGSGTASPYGGANDSFDGTTIAIYDDTGGTVGSFDGTDAVITSLNDVAADGGQKVAYIVYSPTDLTESYLETAVYFLKATSKWGDNSGITLGSGTPTLAQAGGSCNGATTVDVVAGDGDGDTGANDGDKDGSHIDDGAYEVCSAIIGVSKTHEVKWDTINYNSFPKSLPGAIVEYTVQIANTGGAACPAVLSTISDTLQIANLTLVPTFYDGGWGTATPTSSTSEAFVVSCSAACGVRACESGGYTFTSGNDADGIEFVTPTFTATMTTLLPIEDTCTTPGSITGATDTVTIKFQATIN